MKTYNTNQTNVFEILCKTISEGVIIVNKTLGIVTSNEAVEDIFGYNKEELVGQSFKLLFPKKYQSQLHQSFNNYFTFTTSENISHRKDIKGIKKDGSIFPVDVSMNSFEFDEQRLVLFLITDNSLALKQQQEIIELNQRLGKMVDERTLKLRQTIVELKDEISRRKEAESKTKAALDKERELNELKTKFLSLVSHEFKTPLSVILSSASLAEKYTKPQQQEKREKHFNNIKLKVKSLNNILNDFLSIERLQTEKDTYRLEDFPLSRVVNNVVYDANMLSKEGQKIHYPENIDKVLIHYDEQILELTLTNLINNAIKYSPEDSNIDITVNIKKDKLNISVADEGMGIPEKEQKFIFDPYFRAENVLHKAGTGIGLNMVKGHLEKLNSTVRFTSKEGQGSTFTISIPYKNKR
ncbi:MAG TPA: ATP-binding protein [Flavobacteriaceae bacterium]|nr:ATP-binding protein [Flavobacteriaceae bacterium]